MTDLLREAIADANAVKEVALANAKQALEEAFRPRLQSMIASKLAEEAEDDEMDMEEEPMGEGEDEDEEWEAPVEEEYDNDVEDGYDETLAEEDEEEAPAEEPAPEPEAEPEMEAEPEPEAEEAPVEEGDDEEWDAELEEIIRELEEELDSSDIGTGDNKQPSPEASDDNTQDPGKNHLYEEDEVDLAEPEEIAVEGDEEEDIDIQEIMRALREEDGEEEAPAEEPAPAPEEPSEDLEEAYAVIKYLRSKLNEVNLLNSKLLFSNKLFRKYSLTEGDKMTVIENFDRAGSLREVKLVYATLSESLATRTRKSSPRKPKRSLKEGIGGASRPQRSTKPSKGIIKEGDESVNRLRKLAGLIK